MEFFYMLHNDLLGDGCIYDKMENRFFWISDRAKSEIESVKDHGGPKAYCNALGKVGKGK